MQINVENVSKRYRFEWILKNVNYEFQSNNAYAILGPNGSGKSTLLRMLSGFLTPTKGKVNFTAANAILDADNIFKRISYSGPYIDLIEEFTLMEAIQFHQKFKQPLPGIDRDALLDILSFSKSNHKEVRHFSSGMKQRLKLALAITTDSPALFLDEPTTNLDRQGMNWYKSLIEQFKKDRLIIVASNIEEDYYFCQEHLSILDYK